MIFYQNKEEKIFSFPIFVLFFLLGHISALIINLHNFIIIFVIVFLIFISFFLKKKGKLIIGFIVPVFLGLFNANLFLSPNLTKLQLEKYNLNTETVTVKGVINNLINRKWSQSGDLKINKIYIKSQKLNLSGNIKFSNSSKLKLKAGQEVLLRGELLIPDKAKNLGAFNYKLYLKRKSIFYTMKVKHTRDIKVLSNHNLSLLENIKLSFKNRILSFSENKTTSGFYLSILLGDKSYLDKNLKENMLSLGIIHLLAISGFHIAILFSIFYVFTLFLLRLSIKVVKKVDIFKFSSVFSILFITFYLFLIDFQTSATRAVIMISLFSLSQIFEKKFNPLNILALAALVILLFDRSAFLSIGFYLSFLAVLTFFIPIKIIKTYFNSFNKYQKFALNYLSVNISIFLVTTPVLLFSFYKVSLGQLIFNLIFIPIFSFIIYPISLFSAVFKIDFLVEYNYLFFESLARVLSGNYFFINPINTLQLILSVLIIIVIFYLMMSFKFKNLKFIASLIVFYFIVILFPSNREKSGLNIYTLSVGNGDASLITYKNKSILIDAGSKLRGNNAKRVIIPHLDYLNIKQIDYGIVTHLDEDHYGGFIDLVKENRIKTIISSVEVPKELKSKNINYKLINKDENIMFSDIDILLLPSNQFKGKNNNSLVTYFKYKNIKFLFVGDMEHEREKLFIKKYKNIKNIDFLKLGHHGAKKSSSVKFLNHINPKNALISSGKNNRFKHPHKETLKRLDKLNVNYYRTDLNGEIIINIDNKVDIKFILTNSY